MRTYISSGVRMLLLLGMATALAGCYTMEGAGRDTAAAGSGLSAGAEQTREYSAQQPGPGSNESRR